MDEKSLRVMENGLLAAPYSWEMRRHLIEYYFEQGEVQRAGKFVQDAPNLPEFADDLLYAAEVVAHVDANHALTLIDHLLTLSPDVPKAWVAKANVLDRIGRAEEAEQARHHAAGLQSVSEQPVETQSEPPAASEAQIEEPVDPEYQPESPQTEPEAHPHSVMPVSALPARRPLVNPQSIPVRRTPMSDLPVQYAAHPVYTEPAGPQVDLLVEDPVDHHWNVVHEVNYDAARPASMMVAEEQWEQDEKVSGSQTTTKITAIAITILLHILIIIGLFFWIFNTKNEPPPEIVMLPPPVEQPEEIKPREVTTRLKQQKPSQTSPAISPVIVAAKMTPIAVPTVDIPVEMPVDFGIQSGTGFGLGQDSGSGFSGPSGMKQRCSTAERISRLVKGGGSPKCEGAVIRGLRFLKATQNKDGSWGKEYKASMTGLALLAFVGHCETPDSPRFGKTVLKAMVYLTNLGKRQGGFIHSSPKRAYEHGIATYALAEAYSISRYGKTKLPGVRETVEKACRNIIKAQNKHGGWHYNYAATNADMSVSGWQIQALKAASHTQITISGLDRALKKALDYVIKSHAGNGTFNYHIGKPKGSMAPIAAVSMQMMKRGKMDEAQKALSYINKAYASKGGLGSYYTEYYNTLACFSQGGAIWAKWNKKFQGPLLKAQKPNGAWHATGAAHGPTGAEGHHYHTCLAILMLEVYYRYLPATLGN